MPFRTPVEVRFRDLDALGHVNNAVYLTYFENARAAYWRMLVPDRPTEYPFLVARAEIDFRASVEMDTPLVAELALARIGRTSFTFEYRLLSGERVMAEGRTVQVWIGADGRPAPVPDWVRERVAAVEG